MFLQVVTKKKYFSLNDCNNNYDNYKEYNNYDWVKRLFLK